MRTPLISVLIGRWKRSPFLLVVACSVRLELGEMSSKVEMGGLHIGKRVNDVVLSLARFRLANVCVAAAGKCHPTMMLLKFSRKGLISGLARWQQVISHPKGQILTSRALALESSHFAGILYTRNIQTSNFGGDMPKMGGLNWKLYLSGTGVFLFSLFCYGKMQEVDALSQVDDSEKERPDLPTYTAEHVSKHDTKDKRIWVSYKKGVYDITDFLPRHPGGTDKIIMSAGGSVEPFWLVYGFHCTPEILGILPKYRIGNLDVADVGQAVQDLEDPYANDPQRLPVLIVRSQKPFNAEPPTQILADSYVTPNDLFFVRNHLPVPVVDPEDYRLTVCGIGMKTVELSLEDLRTKFKQHTVTATLQCAGNRRDEMNSIKQVRGLTWGNGAISTAFWTGVRLGDILRYAGFREDNPRVQHVQFEGLDVNVTGECYGASIPHEKSMDPDVIVAIEMNGKPIPRDHGFPARVVVPGTAGARSVKWVSKIIASESESQSFWQQNDYKLFSPGVDWDTVNFASSPAIQGTNVQGVICEPAPNSTVKPRDGKITIKGYAFSGDGRKVIRVDVTADGGKTWHVADLRPDNSSLTRAWAWTFWRLNLPVDCGAGQVEILCRAVDSSGNVQPERVDHVWNLRGVLNNAWHRVKFNVACN